MKNYNWLMVMVFISFLSCEKNRECCVMPNQFTEFIFGTYYGECMGEACIETFKLEDERLFEDKNDNYAGPFPYAGDWELLSDKLYEKVRYLPNAFPHALYDETKTTIGMPDAGDWGGIYVEVETVEGNRFHWNIDTMEDNLPEYLHEFATAVQEAVMSINE